MATIYERLRDAGVPLDNHESDLYAKRTRTSETIVEAWCLEDPSRRIMSTFVSQIDGCVWYEFPFCFDPWWAARLGKKG